MPKRDHKPRASQGPAERPEFPKPLVRLKSEAGGYGCEVLMVGDSDGEGAAKDGGWQPLTIPEVPADFQEYPKWVYHADGRRQIVHSQEDADTLEGFEDAPVTPEGDAPASKDVPPPVAQATAGSLKNRPPVPVDRG